MTDVSMAVYVSNLLFLTSNQLSTIMDSNQQAILKTSENALQAKAAAVRAGYYDDAFLAPFATLARGRRPPYVQPIIKRGTHARVCCIDRMLCSFVQLVVEQHEARLDEKEAMDEGNDDDDEQEQEDECVVQIVVLGCGKDTIFFRNQEVLTRNSAMTLKWFEVDHPPMIQEKANTVAANPDVFDNVNVNKVDSDTYEIEPSIGVSCVFLGHDLREEGVMEKLQRAGCAPNTPTLFILECVLMYLPDNDSQTLLQSIAASYRNQAYLCFYEPILGSDAFGNVMENNLSRAGLATPESSLRQTRTLHDQLAKVVEKAGWSQATACDLWHAYDTIVTAAQRQRGNRAEFLDEWEEFVLIMQHYCFLVAATGPLGDALCQIAPKSLIGFSPGQAEHLKR